MPLKLDLTSLSEVEVFGCYGSKKNILPTRMRFLHPRAREAFLKLDSPRVRVSDMFRSAEASLAAVKARRGAQPPSFSGHNYGLSIDVDVDWCLKKGRFASKLDLDSYLELHGWQCHRRDHKLEFEAWHYNWRIDVYLKATDKTTAPALERKIQDLYGEKLKLTKSQAQECLKRLGLYNGTVDGILGPLSREAIAAFQRAWQIQDPPQTLGSRTQRLLAYVSAPRI